VLIAKNGKSQRSLKGSNIPPELSWLAGGQTLALPQGQRAVLNYNS